MDRQPKTAQVKVIKPGVGEGAPGNVFWATADRARALVAAGAGELVNSGYVPADHGILRRSIDWPWDRFSRVEPKWAGLPVIIIGGGPSLSSEQIETARRACATGRCKAIAINDAYLWADWADVLYAADSSWWADHARGIPKPMLKLNAAQVRERFEAFQGDRCAVQNSGSDITDARVHLLRNKNVDPNGRGIHGTGLSLDPGALVTGSHSGWQALNVAVLAGARDSILIGFDGQVAKDGRTHWSGGHPMPTPEAAYAQYRKAFSLGESDLKAAGVRVLNASPGTAIDTFEKVDLRVGLARFGISV